MRFNLTFPEFQQINGTYLTELGTLNSNVKWLNFSDLDKKLLLGNKSIERCSRLQFLIFTLLWLEGKKTLKEWQSVKWVYINIGGNIFSSQVFFYLVVKFVVNNIGLQCTQRYFKGFVLV